MPFVILGAKFHLESKGKKTKLRKHRYAIVIIIIITVVLIMQAASIRMKYGFI